MKKELSEEFSELSKELSELSKELSERLSELSKEATSTPVADQMNLSLESTEQYTKDDIINWIYQLGLLFDKKIPLKELTNIQRIEMAVRKYCDKTE